MTFNFETQNTGNRVQATATDDGITIDYGFDTLTIPWDNIQIWDFDNFNPCQIYNGKVQYQLAYSTGDIKGTNIRMFASKHKMQFNVPQDVFIHVAKLLGKEDTEIEKWERAAKPYVPTIKDAITTVAKADLPI